jgi:phospholipase/carboxylesterase
MNTSLHYVFRQPKQIEDRRKPPLLLFLHGIGADENDLFGLAPFFDGRFFVASARAPIALSYGGYAWFELFFTLSGIKINLEQAQNSRRILLKFIDELVTKHDLDAEKVFLCGFSQGAIIGYSIALSEPEKLAGMVAMSGRLVPEIMPETADFGRLEGFPLLVVHGTLDPVLPVENGRAAQEFLAKLPVQLDYHEYRMAHQISEESLMTVVEWVNKQIS